MSILINTHGGLGNQIFQIFYALSIRENERDRIYLQHLNYYKHKFSLEIPTDSLGIKKPNLLQSIIMHSRVIKLCEKFHLNNGDFDFFGTRMLDGYFQCPYDYHHMRPNDLRDSLELLRKVFGIKTPARKAGLIHLRLGDFFSREEEKIKQIHKSLDDAPLGFDIVTNEYDLLGKTEFKDKLKNKNLQIICTNGYSAHKLLLLMSNYKLIVSNGSTIALWAAILTKGSVEINHGKLKAFFDFISNLDRHKK